MFDCFIIPSISEGFGISLLEAETNGLICFSSNNVSEALKANAHIFNLDDNIQELVSRIIKERESDRTNAYKDIKLDIKTMIKKIEKVYSNNLELEVLLSIMNLNKKDLDKMNINSKCTVINQCNKESFEEYNNYLIYSNKDKGLSNSRNLGLSKVSEDIIVLCDDDVIYNKDYEKIILDEFKNNKDGNDTVFIKNKEVLKDIKFRKAYKYMKEGSSDFLSTIKRG